MKDYGKELILDIHKCNPDRFTRKSIRNYLKKLCVLLDMKREDLHWWDFKGDPKRYAEAPAHLKGTSVIQFITTSNITIHTLDTLKRVYINIFSCKDFDAMRAREFTIDWFEGTSMQTRIIVRI